MNSGTQESGWIAWFVRNPVAANLLMVGLLAMGLATLWDIRTEEFPASAPNTVTVAVHFDGGSPENVEEGAAVKVEEALSGMEGVFRIQSIVQSDMAVIGVEGKDGYPIDDLKEAVSRRVAAISTFPDQVQRIEISEQQEEREVLNVQIHGPVDHETLKRTALRVRDRLLALPTVNSVSVEGARPYEISIELQADLLRAYDLDFEQVANAVRDASVNLAGGELQTDEGRITLQSRQQVYFGPGFDEILLRGTDLGSVVTLGDVATIRDGFTDQAILSTFQGQPSIALMVKLIGRDSITRAAADTQAVVAQILTENWFPAALRIDTWANEADSIRDSLQLLSTNALVGMALVLVLLALFLDPRIAFWVAVGIPVSFAGAFLVMGPDFIDYSVNNLTVFAFILVLGIVVDDAIVIAENVFTHKQRGGDGIAATITGAREVAVPATFGVLTSVAAFVPLAFTTGNFGGPFRVIAVVAIACLVFSLVESKLILPAHLAGLKVGERKVRTGIWARLQGRVERALSRCIEQAYLPFLRQCLTYRYQALAVSASILIVTVGLIGGGLVQVVLFGEDNDRLVYATLKMAPGTPASETHALAKAIESNARAASRRVQDRYALARDPIVFSHILSDTDQEVTVTIQLQPGTQRPFVSQEFLALWRDQVGHIPGAKSLDFYVDFEDDADLRIELSSPNGAVLADATAEMMHRLRQYSAVENLTHLSDTDAFELDVQLRPEAMLMGLSNRSVISQIRNAVYGVEAQRIQRGQEDVRIAVRYAAPDRDDLDDLRGLAIRTLGGQTVPLGEIADLVWVQRPMEIIRIDGSRVSILIAAIGEDAMASSGLLDQLEFSVFPAIAAQFPGVAIKLAGESEAEDDAAQKLGLGFGIGLLAVYALLAIPLKSYGVPFLILAAVPFGIVGAVLGHLVIGIPLSFLSIFGIIALTGVVVNDSLIFVCRFNQIGAQGVDFAGAVLEAGKSRFRAVFLTSITAFVGLVPLILDRSEQAQELIPMAVSLAFGILFATVITLVIIPVLLAVHRDLIGLFSIRRKVA